MKLQTRIALACLIAIGLGACTQGGEKLDGREMPARSAPAQPGTESLEPANGGPLDLAGVAFLPPEAWEDHGPSGMRKASFSFGPIDGDTDAAEVTVFYFGSGQGGDIESNIRRWVGQMDPPEGKAIEEIVLRSKIETPTGFVLHVVEVDGIFQRSMGGGPMTGGRTKAFPGWRMVGAIIEAPEGNVFFKLVGPDATARAMEESYRAMLGAAEKI
jgi:hypothetical protein